MFSWKIKIFKDDEWIFLRMDGPLPLPEEKHKNVYKMVERHVVHGFSGRFQVRNNSVTKSIDKGKFVLSHDWPVAFWSYSAVEQSLRFVSSGEHGGGGLGFAETEQRYSLALTLSGAQLTNRGFEPLAGTGRGTVIVGGNMPMFRPNHEVFWIWLPVGWREE
ncbi:MAG: hypothetical protein JNL98_24925 [Bryobacterales bacterium]|nr:hypothetical protein [Bryobacterales bacterium]